MSLTIAKTAKKHFIDWNQLPLPAAANWLAARHARDTSLDMSGSVIVVPTSRSHRRLLELLLDYAEHHQLIFTPPEITTIGSFTELLYTPQRPLASPLVQSLAWVTALRNTPQSELRHFTGKIPDNHDSIGWQTLANVLSGWHIELAGNGLTFKDVLKAGLQIEYFREKERWETLARIQRRYLDILNDEKLWDRQTARLVAISHHECEIDRAVFLVGTVDLNPTFRTMLDQVADQVTAIIFADESDHDHFDEIGCLKIEDWEQTEITIDDNNILIGDQPQDQAKLLTRFLQELDGRYGIDQVSISVPDQRLISHVSRSLIECDVKNARCWWFVDR